MDLKFAEFAKEKETLLARRVDSISTCFEVEFVVDYCPKVSICVNPLWLTLWLVVDSQSGKGGVGLTEVYY